MGSDMNTAVLGADMIGPAQVIPPLGIAPLADSKTVQGPASAAARDGERWMRDELRAMAYEQAALRRVAMLAAQGVPPPVVFAAVTEQAGRLLASDVTLLRRREPGGRLTTVGVWSCTGRAAFIAPAAPRGKPMRPGTQARLTRFTQLAAAAIATAEAQAELTASQARIVATADETRRRIERDPHDGAQQRLVALALRLQAAQAVHSLRGQGTRLAAKLPGWPREPVSDIPGDHGKG